MHVAFALRQHVHLQVLLLMMILLLLLPLLPLLLPLLLLPLLLLPLLLLPLLLLLQTCQRCRLWVKTCRQMPGLLLPVWPSTCLLLDLEACSGAQW
jgi:hypothetical protein